MKEESQYLELFDAYQSGELNMKQKEDFEAKLRDDSLFRESYEKFLRNIALIKAMGAGQEMGSMIEQEKKTRIVNRRYILVSALAASVILFFLFNPFAQQSATDLFNEYYEPYPNILTSRDQFSSLDEAMRAYSTAGYNEAIQEFNKIPFANDTVFFYKSISYLATRQPEQALSELHKIKPTSLFHPAVIWYKGMSHLLIQNIDSVEYYWKQLDENDPNLSKANKILLELK